MKKNNITWIIIAIIAILFVGYLIYDKNKTNKPFNQIQLTRTSLVLNNSTMPFIDTILYVGLDSMDIYNIVITVYDLTDDMKINFSATVDLKASIFFNDGLYYLWLDKMNRRDAISVIAHELIHIRQYYTKELTFDNGTPIWRGDSTVMESLYYFDRPWEIEAFAAEDSIMKKISNTLY